MNPSDGKIKLYMTYKSLQIRNENAEIFNEGNFIPIETGGEFKDNIIVFARNFDDNFVITIAPRFLTSLIEVNSLPIGADIWKDTFINLNKFYSTELTNSLTGEKFERKEKLLVGNLLKNFPYGLIVKS